MKMEMEFIAQTLRFEAARRERMAELASEEMRGDYLDTAAAMREALEIVERYSISSQQPNDGVSV